MKPSLLTRLLTSVGGLGLAATALLWPTVSQAQGFCYMVDADGRVINLDDLCASGGASEESPSQSETPGANSAQPSPAPRVRSFTIIGAPVDADPSAAAETPGDSADAESTDSEPVGEEPTGNESTDGGPASNESMGESMGEESAGEEPVDEEPADSQGRPGIPVREITPPSIEVPQIQTPAAPGSSTSAP